MKEILHSFGFFLFVCVLPPETAISGSLLPPIIASPLIVFLRFWRGFEALPSRWMWIGESSRAFMLVRVRLEHSRDSPFSFEKLNLCLLLSFPAFVPTPLLRYREFLVSVPFGMFFAGPPPRLILVCRDSRFAIVRIHPCILPNFNVLFSAPSHLFEVVMFLNAGLVFANIKLGLTETSSSCRLAGPLSILSFVLFCRYLSPLFWLMERA